MISPAKRKALAEQLKLLDSAEEKLADVRAELDRALQSVETFRGGVEIYQRDIDRAQANIERLMVSLP